MRKTNQADTLGESLLFWIAFLAFGTLLWLLFVS